MAISLISKVWSIDMPALKKFVLVSLCDAANDDGECFLCIETMAYKCGTTVRSVQRHLIDLEKSGFISRKSRRGRSSIYSVVLSSLDEAEKHPFWLKRQDTQCRPRHSVTPDTVSPPPDTVSPAPDTVSPRIITYPSLNLKPSVASKPLAPEKNLFPENAESPESFPARIIFDVGKGMFQGIAAGHYREWDDLFKKLDIDAEIGKAEAWLKANPRKRKKNYERFLLNWFNHAAERLAQPARPFKPQANAPRR